MAQRLQFDNFINGEWRKSDSYTPNVNPSDTNEVIAHYAVGRVHDVHDAIQAARRAQPYWASATPGTRASVLRRTASVLEDRVPELARLLAREEGKTLKDAEGEVKRAAQVFDFFAGEAVRNTGESVDSFRPGLEVDMSHHPVGVIGIITPWNFPIAIPAWKIAPALAYGNAVVFKPADLTPASAWELVKILEDAGLPAGVLNLVMGAGAEVGSAIASSPALDAITFTGSHNVGSQIVATSAANGVRVQCEMGGKNPLVVVDDADLDLAVKVAVDGAYFSTGQRCTASSRLIVTAGIHDEFVNRMRHEINDLRVGHALDRESDIGPVSNAKQLATNMQYLNIAREEGAQVIGGDALSGRTPGYYMRPALVVDSKNEMRINQEEVFGPVASIIKVHDYEEALAVSNDVKYGLSAGICTTSLSLSTDYRRRVQAGMVMVNAPTAGVDPHVSFGGWKASSYGHREQGRAAREFFTKHKTSYVDAGLPG